MNMGPDMAKKSGDRRKSVRMMSDLDPGTPNSTSSMKELEVVKSGPKERENCLHLHLGTWFNELGSGTL